MRPDPPLFREASGGLSADFVSVSSEFGWIGFVRLGIDGKALGGLAMAGGANGSRAGCRLRSEEPKPASAIGVLVLAADQTKESRYDRSRTAARGEGVLSIPRSRHA